MARILVVYPSRPSYAGKGHKVLYLKKNRLKPSMCMWTHWMSRWTADWNADCPRDWYDV